ncbi:hypothetical protein [Brevundimonas sp.]|jgi:hypothetical protein|uniref:hypothetical protein n=1 Tax=Brevundimonas sp. TaxID=1871086 RepID=UPI003783C403
MSDTRIQRRTHEQLREVVLAAIDDKGTTTKHLYSALGYSHTRNVMKVLYKMIEAGELCNAKCAIGAKNPEAYWFKDRAARDAFHAAYKTALAERRKVFQIKWRATEAEKRRAKAAAEGRPVKPPKPPKPPKAPKPVTVKTAKRDRTPPKPKTRRDNAIAEMLHKRRSAEKVPQRAGVAHLPGPADMSQAKVTKAEPPKPRFYVDPATMPRFFSAVPPGRDQLPASSCAARAFA